MNKFVLSAALVALVGFAAPVQAEPMPVEYVRVCDFYGDGFFFIPGTDTCVNAATGETREEKNGKTVYGQIEMVEDAKDAKEGVALGLALPGASVDQGKTFGAAFNVGAFEGAFAVGAAGAYKAGENLTFNGALGVGLERGTVGGRAGVNFSW